MGMATLQRYPVGQKFRLVRFSRYKYFYVLQFCEKFENGRHFWRDKIFFENWDNYSAEIPFR